MVSRELEKECVVVFDEAHNIDNVCIEVCCLPPLRTPSHGLSFGLLASLCLSPDSVVHDAGSTHALAAAWSLSGSTPFAARMLQAAGLQWHALAGAECDTEEADTGWSHAQRGQAEGCGGQVQGD